LRKQYHFRPSAHGFYAWDVDSLIELTRDIEPQNVKLDSIAELDEAFWFGSEDSLPTCRAIVDHAKLIRDADLKHPIILSSDGRVMDGMHRVSKALMDGLKKTSAVRFIEDPKPNYTDVQPNDLPY